MIFRYSLSPLFDYSDLKDPAHNKNKFFFTLGKPPKNLKHFLVILMMMMMMTVFPKVLALV